MQKEAWENEHKLDIELVEDGHHEEEILVNGDRLVLKNDSKDQTSFSA